MNVNLDALKPIVSIAAWVFAGLGVAGLFGVQLLAMDSAGTYFLASIAASLLAPK